MTKEEKCSKTQIGRIVIHKGDDEKRIYPDEAKKYYSDGWKNGFSNKRKEKIKEQKINSKQSNIKKIVVHKNNVEKIIPQYDKDNFLKDGWELGSSLKHKESISKSLQGNAPWNKGLTAETDERIKDLCKNATETKIKRYGSAFHNNNMDEAHKKKIGNAIRGSHPRKLSEDQLKIKLTKDYLTRKKNNTFNSSQSEIDFYNELLKEFPNKTIYKQYKDNNRYPFYCDFYIVEDDKFIELNAHWTHGGMPYDPNNDECKKQLLEWKEKSKTSKFYENAIETWTVRDVKKLETAKKNNLNYQVIY